VKPIAWIPGGRNRSYRRAPLWAHPNCSVEPFARSFPARPSAMSMLSRIPVGITRATALLLALLATVPALAQFETEAPSPTDAIIEVDDAAKFGPGILRIVPPSPRPVETYRGPEAIDELLEAHPEIVWQPPTFPEGKPFFQAPTQTLAELAKRVIYRREIYAFEFAFKPLRQITIDVPQPTGVMEQKSILYMVYRIRYVGGDLRAREELDASGEPKYEKVDKLSYESRRIVPQFVLASPGRQIEYLDRVLPTAKAIIAEREQIRSPLHDSVEISTIDIPLATDRESPGVWGVAIWEDIDPTLDFLSVYVFGLTNAYELVKQDDQEIYRRKVLQLNFYRPGDTMNQQLDRIRFGIPAFRNASEQQYVLQQYGVPERLDYRWIFR